MGHLGHLSRPGHRVTGSSFLPGVRPEFSWFSKKCPKCKTSIWNAEITKVIVSCLLLDWNYWMSVHAINFYIYPWLLNILWPENTFFTLKSTFGVHYRTGSPGQLGLRVAGFPGHWVAGAQNVTQFYLCCSHPSCLCSPNSKIGSSLVKGCGGNCRPGGK